MTIKTEHAGAKNGGGYWGGRADAKERSRKLRRANDRELAQIFDGKLSNEKMADLGVQKIDAAIAANLKGLGFGG